MALRCDRMVPHPPRCASKLRRGNPRCVSTTSVRPGEISVSSIVTTVGCPSVLPGVHVTFTPQFLEQGTTNRWALRAETETKYRTKVETARRQEAAEQKL